MEVKKKRWEWVRCNSTLTTNSHFHFNNNRNKVTLIHYLLSFFPPFPLSPFPSHPSISLPIRSDPFLKQLHLQPQNQILPDRHPWPPLASEVEASAVLGLLTPASGVLPVPSIGLAERCSRWDWETTTKIESVHLFSLFIFLFF